jgi:hypothetical protein
MGTHYGNGERRGGIGTEALMLYAGALDLTRPGRRGRDAHEHQQAQTVASMGRELAMGNRLIAGGARF